MNFNWFTSWKCIHIFAGPTHGKPSQVVLIINNYPITNDDVFELKNPWKNGFRREIRLYDQRRYLPDYNWQALTDTAQRDFSSNDCFCCIIRSTGTEHGICGIDDKPIDIKTITSLFTSDKCPSLDGKPKIFVLGHETFKYRLRAFPFSKLDELPKPEDIKARSILRHLVISEKDFLVWNRFRRGTVVPLRYSWSPLAGAAGVPIKRNAPKGSDSSRNA